MPSPNIRSLRSLLAAASALTLGACAAVGPNFQAPSGPTGAAAQGYAMPGDAAAPGVRLAPEVRAAGPWWQAFGSPELDAAVRQALADSPSLAEATAVLQRAQSEAAAVRGAQLPQVDASGGVSRQRINLKQFGFVGPSPEISLYSIGANVSYDLDLFGGRRRAAEAANAGVEAAARQADAAYLTLSGNVALQAMRIAELRAQVAAVRGMIAEDRRMLEMMRKAQEAGGQSRGALSANVAQLAEDEALLPPIQRQLDAARHQMALLVGKSPAEYSAPDFDLARLAVPAEVPVSLPSELVRRRPDILASEAELHQATARIGVAVANQYPNLRLTANLTQGALEPTQLFNYSSTGWNLLAGVAAPIFHGGTLKAERQVAEAESRAALARYQQTVLRAFVQVSDVLANLASDQQAIASLQLANRAADQGLTDAQSAYRLGGGTLLEVAQAQRTQHYARRALVEAQGRRLADLVQLYAATAADWRAVAT